MAYKNVLLIDDDEDDILIFVTALKDISNSVKYTAIQNAREALQRLVAGMLAPEVIFLDLNMPAMNGQSFLAEIKKVDHLKQIPVIIFSTSSQEGVIKQAKALGADGFITKPDSVDDLVRVLNPLLT